MNTLFGLSERRLIKEDTLFKKYMLIYVDCALYMTKTPPEYIEELSKVYWLQADVGLPNMYVNLFYSYTGSVLRVDSSVLNKVLSKATSSTAGRLTSATKK